MPPWGNTTSPGQPSKVLSTSKNRYKVPFRWIWSYPKLLLELPLRVLQSRLTVEMLFAIFALTLASLAAASPLKRAPVLVVNVSSGSSSVNSVDDLSLTATVENTVSIVIKSPRSMSSLLEGRSRHQSLEIWHRCGIYQSFFCTKLSSASQSLTMGSPRALLW